MLAFHFRINLQYCDVLRMNHADIFVLLFSSITVRIYILILGVSNPAPCIWGACVYRYVNNNTKGNV